MKIPALLVTAALSLSALNAFAGQPSKVFVPVEPAQESRWWFRLAPYAWVTATEGDITLAGIQAPVDVSMADTLDSLDMALMGLVEGGYGPFGLGVDAIYGKVSDGANLPGTFGFKSVEISQEQLILTPRASYRLIDAPEYQMDLLAGARWTQISIDFTLRRSVGGQETRGSDHDWWDPVVGVRGTWNFAERWFLQYSGLVGGFGTSSDFLWDAFAGFGFRFNDNVSAVLGYRGLGIDYEAGSFGVDTIAHGIVLGLGMEF